MKMILKKKPKINLALFTKKNYLIFLLSFLIISIIIGIIFFIYLNTNDKEILTNNIKSYFTIKDNYGFLKQLFISIKNNFLIVFIVWMLGISIIGSVFNLFVYFIEGFSIGISVASIFFAFKAKGTIGIISYLFPSKLIYLFIIFIMTYFSIKFSYYLINHLFFKKDINLQEKLKKYIKIFIVGLLLSLICSLFEVFINPFMIKLFTFFIK